MEEPNEAWIWVSPFMPNRYDFSNTVKISDIMTAQPRRIRCEPKPGPNGTINYVQDWCGLTEFG